MGENVYFVSPTTHIGPRAYKECASKYLESRERASYLLEQSEKAQIKELLRIPIVLLMVCILYHEHQSPPSSKTDIVWKVILMCMDRSTLKHLGKKSSEIADLDEILGALGRLSWESLQRRTKQLLIRKVNSSHQFLNNGRSYIEEYFKNIFWYFLSLEFDAVSVEFVNSVRDVAISSAALPLALKTKCGLYSESILTTN